MTIPTLMGQILFLSSLCILGLAIARITRMDLTLSSLFAGVAGSLLVPWLGIDTGVRADNIRNLIFYIILPVLIFEAAWNIKPGLLKRWLTPIFLLSTVGVLLGCGVFAVITYYGIGHSEGFPWIAAILTGAILAASDPIAVIAKLKDLSAPEDLAIIIEGESLFNDATAILLFGFVLSFAEGTAGSSEHSYFISFLTVFFGGIMVGALSALIASTVALFLTNRSAGNIVLILLAFSSFYVAEHILHVSGVMSVMTAAILSKTLLNKHQERVLRDTQSTWEWLGKYFNSLIFVLMGLTIVFAMFADHWLSMTIAIIAALIARAAVVFGIGFTTMLSTRKIPFDWQMVMFWGGLKGAIAIALVLSLPTSLPYWWTIQSMVFGVVLFSILVQGTTTGYLVKPVQSEPNENPVNT